jgi:hypothetical protein
MNFVLSPVCFFIFANVQWVLKKFITDGQSLSLFGEFDRVHISSISLFLKAVFCTVSQNISSFKQKWQNISLMCSNLILRHEEGAFSLGLSSVRSVCVIRVAITYYYLKYINMKTEYMFDVLRTHA